MVKFARLEIQSRDLEILAEIHESPACTRTQIADAFFSGKYEAAKKRLQQLARAGLVENNDKSATGRTILRPTSAGLEMLGAQLRIVTRIPERMHRHELMLANVISALKVAASGRGLQTSLDIGREATFHTHCTDHGRAESVNPDAFFALRGTNDDSLRHFFFIEVDRSTETQAHVVHLAKQYRTHQYSMSFAAKFGHPFDRKAAPFRVLFITKSQERISWTGPNFRHLAKIGTLIWMATIADFLKDPFGAIWWCPLDFEGLTLSGSPRSLF